MSNKNRRPQVLICDPISAVGVEMLQSYADVEAKPDLNSAELAAVIPGYEAMIVRSATKVTGEIIEQGSRLKVIGRAGAGLDNIDVAAAEKRGIQVVNAPDANTLAVAELTIGLMLALARHIPRGDATMKQGEWAKSRLKGIGLAGKVVGLIGFGRIARAVARRVQAFDMKVVVTHRRPTPQENAKLGVETVSLNELLQQSDFVSLHVPARPETENMIGAQQLALMKSTAYLINTARGSVVDEAALLQALTKGAIAGAGLDVYKEEPVTNHPLGQHKRVVATPHLGAGTVDAQEAAAVTVVEKIIEVLRRAEG